MRNSKVLTALVREKEKVRNKPHSEKKNRTQREREREDETFQIWGVKENDSEIIFICIFMLLM